MAPESLGFLVRDIGGILPESVISFNFLHNLFHLFDLLLPLVLAHLSFFVEEFHVGLAVGAKKAIPESGVLAVVVIEV